MISRNLIIIKKFYKTSPLLLFYSIPYTRNKRHLEKNTKERPVSYSSRQETQSVCQPQTNLQQNHLPVMKPNIRLVFADPQPSYVSPEIPTGCHSIPCPPEINSGRRSCLIPLSSATDKFSVWLISYTSVDSSGRVLVPWFKPISE